MSLRTLTPCPSVLNASGLTAGVADAASVLFPTRSACRLGGEGGRAGSVATDHRSLPRNPWVVEKRAGRGCGSAAGRKQGRGPALGLFGLPRQGAVGEGGQIRKQAYRKASCPTVGLYMSQPRVLAPKFCCPLKRNGFGDAWRPKPKNFYCFHPWARGWLSQVTTRKPALGGEGLM